MLPGLVVPTRNDPSIMTWSIFSLMLTARWFRTHYRQTSDQAPSETGLYWLSPAPDIDYFTNIIGIRSWIHDHEVIYLFSWKSIMPHDHERLETQAEIVHWLGRRHHGDIHSDEKPSHLIYIETSLANNYQNEPSLP